MHRLLPTRGDLVQFGNTAGHTRYIAFVLGGLTHTLERLFDHRVDLGDIAFLCALRDLEDTTLCLMQQHIYVLRLIITFLLYLTSHRDKVTCGSFLRHDLRMVTQVSR